MCGLALATRTNGSLGQEVQNGHHHLLYDIFCSWITNFNNKQVNAFAGGFVLVFCGLELWAERAVHYLWPVALMILIGILMLCSVLYLNSFPKSTERVYFMVPLVPFIPALSILINVYLMFKLSAVTWIRFFIWMVVGNKQKFKKWPSQCLTEWTFFFRSFGVRMLRFKAFHATISVPVLSLRPGRRPKWRSLTAGGPRRWIYWMIVVNLSNISPCLSPATEIIASVSLGSYPVLATLWSSNLIVCRT